MFKKQNDVMQCTENKCNDSYKNFMGKTFEITKKDNRLQQMINARKSGNTKTVKK